MRDRRGLTMQVALHPAYLEEKEFLDETNRTIDMKITQLERQLRSKTSDPIEIATFKSKQVLYRSLIEHQDKPYFGRLDFVDQEVDQQETYYIGKMGITKEDGITQLIVDWRTPLAGVYNQYSGADEEITYIIDGKEYKLRVLLKRRIEIEKKEIKQIVDTVSAKGKSQEELSYHDPYLAQILQREGKTGELPLIIETIQKEQDQIIRAPLDRSLVIQGAAGSGKSSIALHRLSYLLFNNRNMIKTEKLIIFAPNRLFLSYIANTISNLELNGMRATTFLDWAKDRLENLTIIPLYQKVDEILSEQNRYMEIREIGKFKGSLECKDGIERYMHFIIEQVVPEIDFEINPLVYLSYYKIKKIFTEDYRDYPINKRIEKTIESVETFANDFLNEQLKKLDDQYDSEKYQWVEPLPKGSSRQKAFKYIESHYLKRKETIINEVRTTLSEYKKKWIRLNPVTLYRELFSNRERLLSLYQNLRSELVDKIIERLNYLKKDKAVDYEDLAPILHIDLLINGNEQYFDHIVIDEAQDYSPYQMEIIKNLNRNRNSITILGDLAQGIYDYNGVDDWSEFKGVLPEMEYRQISFNYRSTHEIVTLSNIVLGNLSNLNIPIPVHIGRKGDVPNFIYVEEKNRLVSEIAKEIKRLLNTTNYTIAIITLSSEEAKQYYTELQEQYGIEIVLLDEDAKGGNKKVAILPISLAKGLEYDAVILTDINQQNYPIHPYFAKLLYVALTRALHTVTIFYTEEITSYFAELVNTKKSTPVPQRVDEWLGILIWGRKHQYFSPEDDLIIDQYVQSLSYGREETEEVINQVYKIWQKLIKLGYKSTK